MYINLANKDDLIIDKPNKVRATVMQNIDGYIQEATRQLEDTNFQKN